ncbi:MAG: hypothetical protein WAU17_05815, partial [Nitrospirales bacterium]
LEGCPEESFLEQESLQASRSFIPASGCLALIMVELEGKDGEGDRQIHILTINHSRLSHGTTASLHRS